MQRIAARPLTKMAFEPFGDVIETSGGKPVLGKNFECRIKDRLTALHGCFLALAG